jgi:hypothetical protein
MNCFQKTYLRFLTLFCLLSFFGNAQNSVPHTLYQQFNGPFDYTIIGNTHNPSDVWTPPYPLPGSMLTSSSATLNLTSNQTIVGAYLIWAGIGNGAGTTISLNGLAMTPDFINNANVFPNGTTPTIYFSAVKDITSYVQSVGNANYQVSNFNLNPVQPLYYSNSMYFAGWNIIVVYTSPTLPNKQLNIYDGYRFSSIGSGYPTINFPINNLNVTNTVGAKMTMISFLGNSTRPKI